MSPRDLLSALAIVLIWGSNFVVMKIGLHDMGPMLLGALRFAVASLPLLWFVRRPALPWRFIAGYGLAQGLGQFGLLFLGLWLGLPAGIASIVLQAQAFFTVLLAALLLGERTRAHQWLGLVAAAAGLVLIASARGVVPVPLAGFVCALGAAAMWAVSNIVARRAQRFNPHYDALALVVWGSAAPVLPFAALALLQDGAAATVQSLRHLSLAGGLAVLYLALVATVAAYSMWARLLKRHAAGRVAPFSLLVPVVGLYTAWLVLDERLAPLQWLGVAVVALGLALNSLGGRPCRAGAAEPPALARPSASDFVHAARRFAARIPSGSRDGR
jgi:O-acetylserine/cysteine efflux transporter